jgi:hypothetical protein
VPSVCEGSKFMGLGDGQGLNEKFQIFFIPYVFYRNLKELCQANFASNSAKTMFWSKIS